ncbi:MAG: ParB/RepB/Spo0J family partition protein [Clostridia bacterium]|nr:ParB/RepB/Spo0J family partition protein [Clostridia bacterium]
MTISGYNDLFNSSVVSSENIVKINIKELHSFKNHPFKVIDDNEMDDLVESIRNKGVINPIIVREHSNSAGYEIIAGHRRCRAATLAGLTEIPALIKNITDDDAIIEMVDSNIYRSVILPSEKAYSYKMKQKAMKHQGKKGIKTNDEVGKKFGDSARNVQRYIRLTYLIPELLKYIDEEPKKRLIIGENLSHLNKEEQTDLYNYIIDNGSKFPSLNQSKLFKDLSERSNPSNPITLVDIDKIMKSKPKKNKNKDIFTLSISTTFLNKYFNGYEKDEIEDILNKIIEEGLLKGEYDGKNKISKAK